MSKIAEYRQDLSNLGDWDAYLLAHSALPGPRANLELAQAAVDEGDELRFRHWLSLDAADVAGDSPAVFLVVCATIGLGKLLAAGRRDVLPELASAAADPRWRIRESVAMALQRWGDADMPALLAAMTGWADGDPWLQRAAMAALCEPRLLRAEEHARQVLSILTRITAHLAASVDRKSEAFRVLRQALGYGWSVAVVASPREGKPVLAALTLGPDPDVRWIVRENLKKNRLARMDAAWVNEMKSALL